jgi:hypothetical protein
VRFYVINNKNAFKKNGLEDGGDPGESLGFRLQG